MRLAPVLAAALSAGLLTVPVAAQANHVTPPSPASHSSAAFAFGVMADVQYWAGPTRGTRFYSESTTKLADAAETINDADVEFTVQVGDLIDRDMVSFDEILPVFEQIEGPRYHVLGNHDFPVPDSQAIVDRLGMTNEYYDFSHQNWRFVILDTNDISTYANPVGSPDYLEAQETLAELKEAGAVNAQSWDGAVGDEQRAWLRGVLADAKDKDQKVIVFGHMPVNGENAHNAWDAEQVREVLESQGNVVAYFNGHDHAGRYGVVNGIHYVNLKGMVEKAYPANAYSVVTVQEGKVRIDGYGAEPDRVLDVPSGR